MILSWKDGLRFGALGFPLAFVALPLYVVLPNHYAVQYGVPLASLGVLLLLARLFDGVVDPLMGRWVDQLLSHSFLAAWAVAAAGAVVLALGFYGLFAPPVTSSVSALLAWCGVLLVITYLSYSLLTVIHQAWGARLGGNGVQQTRIIAWREGSGLVGVLVASVLPSLVGLGWTAGVLAGTLVLGIVLLRLAPSYLVRKPSPSAPLPQAGEGSLVGPLQTTAFRRLLGIYLVNGIASAIPATLVLFFINDRLQAPNYQPLFLGSYFAAGALSMPLWVRLVRLRGLVGTWQLGMVLAVAVFALAMFLRAGDVIAFTVVCILSGVALGADLTLPSAMLTRVIAQAGHAGQREGAYLGWWHFATKLNLAIAAGTALPLLSFFGYAPGKQGASELAALSTAYCLLPCALKLLAIVLLRNLPQGKNL
jgi:glycoside/pentoside/hexuronide:cation symporter, GPH family